MSTRPNAGPPVPPASVGRTSPGQHRPWWSEIDVLLAIVWFMLAMIVAATVSAIAAQIGGDSIDDDPVYALFFGTAIFQVLQVVYPWLISRWKGLGLEADWRFVSSLPNDIGYGLMLGLTCLLGAWVTTVGIAELVGLENTDDASNTAILTDNKESLWIYGVVFLVVVGAPLAEELLFRGLILRIFQKSFGSAFAIIASSLLFTLPHWQADATWQETVVLLSALAMVGLILAIGAVLTDRLGPSVIAHFLFNGAGTLLTLT